MSGPVLAWSRLRPTPALQVSAAAVLQASPSQHREAVDLDLDLDSSDLKALEEQLSRLTAGQLSAHLLRIERSVLRQERLSIEILSALQKIATGKGQS